MPVRKQVNIQFIIDESSVVEWQSVLRKLLDMPSVGFVRMFTESERSLIEALAELSNVDKGKEVVVSAGNTYTEQK